MKHFGDITKISGYELPVVDIITGGSPCQDLSVAGKRAGLEGERSGLFMEQIRIVKEMRERDRESGRSAWAIRPRYMVWENVTGAFSSNGGKDFQAVLEEIVGIVEDDVHDLSDAVQGKWTKAGCLYDEMGAWSIAWRVHDAQFWGVPQRRKRIALVADFGGLSAPEILLERKGLRGDSEEGGETREGTAAGVEGGADNAESIPFGKTGHGYWQRGFQTVRANPSHSSDLIQNERVGALRTPNNQAVLDSRVVEPVMLQNNQNNAMIAQDNGDGKTVPTITGDHGDRVTDYTAVCVGNGQLHQMSMTEQSNTLDTMHDHQAILTFDKEMYNCGEKMGGVPQARYDNVAPTVRADSHPSGVCTSTVRRLTPLECERLQGYPDCWTDIGEWVDSKGKKHKDADSPRYKALGNSIALPFWAWMARRICAQYERPMTMASLFDGIGGFPLVFSRAGAVPVWASEIEEFPIAVTKRHFPEEEPHET